MKISAFLSLPYRLLAGLRLGETRGVMRIENHTLPDSLRDTGPSRDN
jgi:hypothetical protein